MTLLTKISAAVCFISVAACTTLPPVSQPHFLLLGEVHDNPAGHQKRYDDLALRIKKGWRPAIVMEQFDLEQNADLQAAMQQCTSADCVIAKVGKNNWTWPLYRPVIEMAISYHLPLIAGNLSRQRAFSVVSQGYHGALSAQVMKQYQLPHSVSDTLLTAQKQEIEHSHCGMAPEDMLAGFAQAQIARDIMMADTLMRYASNQDVVLIAGNGHVRKDIGVPYWLREQHQSDIQSVGYLEQDTAMPDAAFDQQVRIPAQQRPDMCKNLKMKAAQ